MAMTRTVIRQEAGLVGKILLLWLLLLAVVVVVAIDAGSILLDAFPGGRPGGGRVGLGGGGVRADR